MGETGGLAEAEHGQRLGGEALDGIAVQSGDMGHASGGSFQKPTGSRMRAADAIRSSS